MKKAFLFFLVLALLGGCVEEEKKADPNELPQNKSSQLLPFGVPKAPKDTTKEDTKAAKTDTLQRR